MLHRQTYSKKDPYYFILLRKYFSLDFDILGMDEHKMNKTTKEFLKFSDIKL